MPQQNELNYQEVQRCVNVLHVKCSDEQHSLVRLALNFAAVTRHARRTRMNHPHFLPMPLIRSTRTASSVNLLWKKLAVGCFRPIATILASSNLSYGKQL